MICYDDYPARVVALNLLEVVATVSVGVVIIAQFGLGAALAYVGLGLLAIGLSLAFGCTRCRYHGRVCGTGLGTIAARIFKKRDEDEFGTAVSQRISWTLVGFILILPVGVGLISLKNGFTPSRVLWLAAFLGLMSTIAITHSRLVCSRCHEAKANRCSLGRLGRHS